MESPPIIDTCQDNRQEDKCHQITAHWRDRPSDNGCMPGKKSGEPPTIEIRRFSWLVAQLEKEGIGQAEMARRTGIESSHINKLKNFETSGRKALSADIIRRVKDGLKLDPEYFFDEYDGPCDYKVYDLTKAREKKRVGNIESTVEKLAAMVTLLNERLSQTEAELSMLKGNRKRGAH